MYNEGLLSELRRRYPESGMQRSPEGIQRVIFPAISPEVGDVELQDDGYEVTLYLGTFTHVHFYEYQKDISELERAQRVANRVINFLDDLFADRIEFFGNGFGGGCRARKEARRGILSRLLLGSRTYVWSGPVRADG